LSTSDARLFFGVGSESIVSRLEIEWPSGKKQTVEDIRANQVLLMDEAGAKR
jgi:hypothetical protein